MALILIEGARKAGKTHLLDLLGKVSPQYKSFKFDFTGSYIGLGLPANARETHMFGVSKEIMLHQLNRDKVIGNPPIIVDRGILTCAVWGVLEKRISLKEAETQLTWMAETGLFNNMVIIDILGTFPVERKKDIWDHMDERVKEESELFSHFFSFLTSLGVSIISFNNTFDIAGEENFYNLIEKIFNDLCAEY
jgi:hypothetical protein